MTHILALAGKKQSGKNTAANFILATYLAHLGIVRGCVEIKASGAIHVTDVWGNPDVCGEFNMDLSNDEILKFFNEYIHPYVKQYSFADMLKDEVCIKILGLTYEQCYGTDEQKNSETHLKWEDMPGVITTKTREAFSYDGNGLGDYHLEWLKMMEHEEGHMTAREVMQYVGSDVFRKMYHNVWADATIRKIKQENTELAIITDCRFPNEVEAVQNAGGKVVRLNRDPFKGKDQHVSETALDQGNFDWAKFDSVIDNAQMNIKQQNQALYTVLAPWSYMPEIT